MHAACHKELTWRTRHKTFVDACMPSEPVNPAICWNVSSKLIETIVRYEMYVRMKKDAILNRVCEDVASSVVRLFKILRHVYRLLRQLTC
jgi:hypothetical protein